MRGQARRWRPGVRATCSMRARLFPAPGAPPRTVMGMFCNDLNQCSHHRTLGSPPAIFTSANVRRVSIEE